MLFFPPHQCLLLRGSFTQSVEVANDGLKCLLIFSQHYGSVFLNKELIIFHHPLNSRTVWTFFGWISTGWCSTPTLLLICSSFSRENGYPMLICSSLSAAQSRIQNCFKHFFHAKKISVVRPHCDKILCPSGQFWQHRWSDAWDNMISNIIYHVKYFHSVDACRAISVTSQTMKGSGLSQNIPWSENHHVEGEDSMKWQNRWLLLDSNKLKTKNSTHFLPNQFLSNYNPLNIPQL